MNNTIGTSRLAFNAGRTDALKGNSLKYRTYTKKSFQASSDSEKATIDEYIRGYRLEKKGKFWDLVAILLVVCGIVGLILTLLLFSGLIPWPFSQ